MSLPVNKKTIDDKIFDDLKANSSQAITAPILQNALYPIINSTFGLKTIWSGYVSAECLNGATNQNRSAIFIQEDYYDKNYFPALDPDSLDTALYPVSSYQVNGCRYKLTDQGSNLTGVDGTYSTSIYNTTFNTTTPGYGLTFDVKIVAGSVVAIKVNNPGSGYCWGRYGSGVTVTSAYIPTVVTINIGYSGGGRNPQVTIDLSRVIDMDNKSTSFNDGSYYFKYLNLFIPQASSLISYGPSISLNYINATYFNTLALGDRNQNSSRIKGGSCEYNPNFSVQYPNGILDTSIKGYSSTFLQTSNAVIATNSFKLEVKVPIINTTI